MLKDSLRSVNLLRYYLHPKEKKTSCLYLWKVDSAHLQSKELAMDYIKQCVTAGNIIIICILIGPFCRSLHTNQPII